MPIQAICKSCGTKANAPDSAAGKRGKCKKCGGVVQIPEAITASDVVPKVCANCNRQLGKLETLQSWSGHQVCRQCRQQLELEQHADATSEVDEPSFPEPTEDEVASSSAAVATPPTTIQVVSGTNQLRFRVSIGDASSYIQSRIRTIGSVKKISLDRSEIVGRIKFHRKMAPVKVILTAAGDSTTASIFTFGLPFLGISAVSRMLAATILGKTTASGFSPKHHLRPIDMAMTGVAVLLIGGVIAGGVWLALNPTPANVPISPMTFGDFDSKFAMYSNATDAQKQASIEELKGKRVRWEGIVTNVNGNEIYLREKLTTLTADVVLTCQSSERDKLIEINTGNLLSYEGTIKDFGTISQHELDDGVILSHKPMTDVEQAQWLHDSELKAHGIAPQ